MNSPRKIVFLSHSKETGGAELYLESLISHVAHYVEEKATKSGQLYSLELVCRPDPALDAWCERLAASGIHLHRLSLSQPGDYVRLWRVLKGAVVHLNLAFPFGKYQLVGAVLARLRSRRVVAVHHLVISPAQSNYSPIARRIWGKLFPLYVRLCQRNVALSEENRRSLSQHYGLPFQRIDLIHNGANLEVFRPRPSETAAAVKARLGQELAGEDWSKGIELVCAVGRLNVQKGFRHLIEAAAQVVERCPQARFVIAGDGELRDELNNLIMQQNLEKHFFLVGWREQRELAEWLAASDLFVLSSLFEGFAFAVVEAMACGCAVVATRVGCVEEALTEGETGYVVPTADSVALAAAIVRALKNPQHSREMGRKAAERVVRLFDLKDSLRQTTALYELFS